jgi:hypothetical protein
LFKLTNKNDMKKAILILLLTAAAAGSFAQSKADTAKKTETVAPAKPEFKPDPNKTYLLPALTLGDVQLLVMGPDEWKAFISSQQLSGAYIQQTLKRAEDLRNRVAAKVDSAVNADKAAWEKGLKK